MYLYEGHLGSLYLTKSKQDNNSLYCDQCGDYDWELGEVFTWQDIVNVIGIDDIQVDSCDGGWARDYVYDVMQELGDVPDEETVYKYMKDMKIRNAFDTVTNIRYEKDSEYDLDYYNEILIEEFPFIKETDEGYPVEGIKELLQIYTWIDEIPDGWRRAFGLDLLYELKTSLIKDGCLDTFAFTQIKEKFGTLRIYATGYDKNTRNVIAKYEELSQYFCVHCGKRAKYISQGWICPWCEDCVREIRDTVKPIEDIYHLDIDKEIEKIKTNFRYEDYWTTLN